jgi:Na+-transporting methylmalonyl-CoA/oxaloacetate decarboxylase gamma subunit
MAVKLILYLLSCTNLGIIFNLLLILVYLINIVCIVKKTQKQKTVERK